MKRGNRCEALVLIDLQQDYFASDELQDRRDDLVANCNALVRTARETDVPVIEVRTVHDPDGSTWTMSMREDGQGMALRGSRGAAPLEGLDTEGAVVVAKTRDNAFFGTELRAALSELGVDHVVLCGVSTESCVAATAIDAFAHDLAVTLVSDATASVDPELHDDTLEQLADRYRQQVHTSAEVQERWLGSRDDSSA